jgi:hypothetical protein
VFDTGAHVPCSQVWQVPQAIGVPPPQEPSAWQVVPVVQASLSSQDAPTFTCASQAPVCALQTPVWH